MSEKFSITNANNTSVKLLLVTAPILYLGEKTKEGYVPI